MNQTKSYTFSDKYKVNLRRANSLKRKDRISRNQSHNSEMSTTTKDFIQKICYRKTASIDMTHYGFINDSKMHPVNLMMKPLRAQLEKICGKPRNVSARRNSPTKKKVKSNLPAKAPAASRQYAHSPSPVSAYTPISAQSSPGTHTPRTRVRKVRIYEPTSTTGKKVTLVVPGAKDKKQ